MDVLEIHQTPNIVKSILKDDDLQRILKEFGILESRVLEVSNLFGRATFFPENSIALYEEALKAGFRFSILKVFIELLGWY